MHHQEHEGGCHAVANSGHNKAQQRLYICLRKKNKNLSKTCL